ncbi:MULTISPECIES: 6-carboxytetrahydropterin synthase [unclassified Wenzhouxiangella]|uniref:6-pyruvoyl trahydropterin synthase family protein n=1 Tax=unclassified Wenzhouxiangella TaxID=2613841 RepID=UPI000E32D288|nr:MULTISPECIES: 6-carboxytetrahydropterin synthase [unclassified Wenzhouxiangella]RFF27339.1 6-pyruvoyl tetrahydropterin synthase [Wenzhouxiangella sp. 15181]RFP68771.1 6-pyruvoyl tetrahydropterin synthase [Wenzhouxiangella sp. 15190]
MNPHSLFITALRPFEAARYLPSTGPEKSLHGHGFRARIVVPRSACRPRFPGIETQWLNDCLGKTTTVLDYSLLNDRIPEPCDASVAEWLLDRSGLSGTAGLALQSAPDRGAIVRPEGSRLAWQRFRLEAAHRLPNVPAGHKCGRMHGHGFEVVLFSALDPEADSRTAQRDIADAWDPLHRQLHLTCLNDLPGLENPTSEVLAQWIWQSITDVLPGLAGVTVMETDLAGCHFDGQGWRIWKSMSFDSAVRLTRAPEGDPRRMIHGHTFTTRLHLSGGLDEVMGWVYDYGDVKRRFDPVFRALDHRPLYENPQLTDNDAASIAAYIDAEMSADLPGLSRIDVLSTPGCGALLCRQPDDRGLLVP